MLKTPPIAVQQTKREILNMADVARANFAIACNTVSTLDYSEIETFRQNEQQLNFVNNELAKFIAKLLKADLSERDRIYLTTAFRSLIDIERIGDYSENIVECADKLKQADSKFSADAVEEIKRLTGVINDLFENVKKAYLDCDINCLDRAMQLEDCVDNITKLMADNHVKRLREGGCTPEVGAQYLSLSTNAERIADHLINVAKTIKKYK